MSQRFGASVTFLNESTRTIEKHHNRQMPLLFSFKDRNKKHKNNSNKTKFVLIGLPGVGKSTTFKKCLERLQSKGIKSTLHSTDDIISKRFKMDDPVILQFQQITGLKIPREIFNAPKPVLEFINRLGEEPHFRYLEELFVADIIKNASSEDWFDLGGKAPLRSNIKTILSEQKIIPIFLYAEHETVLQRLGKDSAWKNRSNYFAAGPASRNAGWNILAEMHRKERLNKYIDTATIIINVEKNPDDRFMIDKSPDELVREILYRIKELEIASTNRTNSFASLSKSVFDKKLKNNALVVEMQDEKVNVLGK